MEERMGTIIVDLSVRFWPYFAAAFAIGLVAGWLSAGRSRA